jgi:hypothetical protein
LQPSKHGGLVVVVIITIGDGVVLVVDVVEVVVVLVIYGVNKSIGM